MAQAEIVRLQKAPLREAIKEVSPSPAQQKVHFEMY